MLRYLVLNTFIGIIVLLTLATKSHASLPINVPVSAPTQTSASTHVLQQRTIYWVTKQDIARGYVEIISSVSVDIETSASAINLSVVSLAGGKVLASLAGDYVFSTNLMLILSDVEISSGHTTQNLDVRVLLDESAQVGLYPLNIHLSTNAY
jgi:hypothetical protein